MESYAPLSWGKNIYKNYLDFFYIDLSTSIYLYLYLLTYNYFILFHYFISFLVNTTLLLKVIHFCFELFESVPASFCHTLITVDLGRGIFFFIATTRYSRIILYISRPSRLGHFFRELWFLLLEHSIWKDIQHLIKTMRCYHTAIRMCSRKGSMSFFNLTHLIAVCWWLCFNLQFSVDIWCWASFHMGIFSICIFWMRCLFRSFAHF